MVLYILNLYVFREETRDSELSDSKYYPNLVCSYFLRECDIDSLLLFQNI
jgi:hypothetical protein